MTRVAGIEGRAARTMLISAIREDLCLSYANTLSWRGGETPAETLHDLADLLGWIGRSAGVGARAVQEIKAWSRDHQRAASTAFAEAIAMREVIFRIFSAIAVGEPVRGQDFAALRNAVAKAPRRNRLERSGDGFAWRIEQLRPSAPRILAPGS